MAFERCVDNLYTVSSTTITLKLESKSYDSAAYSAATQR